jgi:hypothetical protein
MTNDLLKRIRVLDPPMSRSRMSTMTANQLPPPSSEPIRASWMPEPEMPRQRGVEIPYFRFPAEPVFSKSFIGSTPLDLESKPRISEADIRSMAEYIVEALDDANFYFGSHEVGIVADLLSNRLHQPLK